MYGWWPGCECAGGDGNGVEVDTLRDTPEREYGAVVEGNVARRQRGG